MQRTGERKRKSIFNLLSVFVPFIVVIVNTRAARSSVFWANSPKNKVNTCRCLKSFVYLLRLPMVGQCQNWFFSLSLSPTSSSAPSHQPAVAGRSEKMKKNKMKLIKILCRVPDSGEITKHFFLSFRFSVPLFHCAPSAWIRRKTPRREKSKQ